MTVGRNDPCPCGSGKKYKKCCMPAREIVSLQEFREKRTSDALLDRLVKYATGGTLDHEVALAISRFYCGRPPEEPTPDDLDMPMDWMMFSYRFPNLGTTLCQHFADHADGLTTEERGVVSGWASAIPGFFEVTAVGASEAHLRRLGDEQAYVVTASGTGLKTGDLAGAFLLPVPSGFRFGAGILTIAAVSPRALEHLLREELGILRRQKPDATWDDLYRTSWPRLIDDGHIAERRGDALIGVSLRSGPAVQGAPVDDAKWRAVADCLAQEMTQDESDPEEVEGGLRLWWDVVHVLRPRVTKVEVWVGALIYIISNRLYSTGLTQDDAAEWVGVSAATVGARARQIEAALDVKPADDRYVDLLNQHIRTEWRFDCLTMTEAGRRDFSWLHDPALMGLEPSFDDDPELDDSEMFRALDLVDLAWEAKGKRRTQLAEQAIQLWPDAADAYVILGNDAMTQRDLQSARRLYQEGMEAAERDLGSEYFAENTGHFWGLDETRPYMRARRGLADILWLLGERDQALIHCKELLRLNPSDNQGTRYALASHFLDMGDDRRLGKLLKAYADDGAAAFIYTRALWEFRQDGPGRDANRWLTDAIKQNPHVPAFLLKERPLPSETPDHIGWGDETEAAVYAEEFGAGWLNTPGALEWLAAKTAK